MRSHFHGPMFSYNTSFKTSQLGHRDILYIGTQGIIILTLNPNSKNINSKIQNVNRYVLEDGTLESNCEGYWWINRVLLYQISFRQKGIKHQHEFFYIHSLVEYLVVQYFSISSAVLPGILPAIRAHLIKVKEIRLRKAFCCLYNFF